MKTPFNKISVLFILCIMFLFVKCKCSKETFEEVKSLISFSSPAISGHVDGAVHIASIDTTGRLCIKKSFVPNLWADWTPVESGFNLTTAPELKRLNSNLYVFLRGDDDNLYYISKFSNTNWGNKIQLTFDGKIKGRISVALTIRDNIVSAHIIHVDDGNSVRYLQINLQNNDILKTEAWSEVIDGVIGSNNANEVALALRKENTCLVYLLQSDDNWSPHLVESTSWRFKNTDLSNIVYFPKKAVFPNKRYDYHFTLESVKENDVDDGGRYRYEINHILVSDDLTDSAFNTLNLPIDFHLAGALDVKTLSAMVLYRDKLLNIRKHPDNNIRYARWDDADPTLPWITSPTVGFNVSTDFRPSAAAFNKRTSFRNNPQLYLDENYGNDLFVAATGKKAILFENFSRTLFQNYSYSQFTIFEYAQSGGCPDQDEDDPPVALNILADDHPYVTELGFNLWMFPNWLIENYYKNVAEYFCDELDTWKNSGRTNVPCNSVKMPIIFKNNGGLYVCKGAWVNKSSDHFNIFEELGHYMTHLMGFCDVCSPTQFNSNQTGIDLVSLTQAHQIFGEEISTTTASPRRVGFTGHGGNYDSTSREHSFIYAVYYYMYRSDELRGFVQEDMDNGNNLLRRKYLWIRDNIFRGVEF